MKEERALKVERRVIIGMISNSDYLDYVSDFLNPKWALAEEARLLMLWVLDYHRKYEKAPGRDIVDIYEKNLDNGRISESQGEVIEDILENLSLEAEEMDEKDLKYLQEITQEYANFAKALVLNDTIGDLLEAGDLSSVQDELTRYEPVELIEIGAVQPLDGDEHIKQIFSDGPKPLFTFNGPIGDLLNPHMVKAGFVVLMGQNKGGKSYHLMRIAFQAAQQSKRVAFFQVGDMTQVQMERRMAILCTGISDQEMYCQPLVYPVLDCQKNQLDTCDKSIRIKTEDDLPFDDRGDNFFTGGKFCFNTLYEAFQNFPKHLPCLECLRQNQNGFKGTIWFKRRPKVDPMDYATYMRIRKREMKKFKSPFHALKNIRLRSLPSESFTISNLKTEVRLLRDKTGFDAEVVVIDYLDLMPPDRDTLGMIPRDQENKKWQRTRRFSQEDDRLLISGTQSDAQGFNKLLLDRSNFSDDRRKLDHVTAMIGLNMSIDEKMMGLMRMNEIVARETDGTKVVNVLHRLQMGQPILNSFY